ncbi:glycerol dehydrogenase [Burkholderia ambifaria]|uniref:glycerol dehydrogenase n=1 Tax=Burkholderia ambifaria TaxID=152480 RepID=UPI001B942360|nr:glycerol dehydrogenase [Burkholderia ambifaria]MBR8256280.1 glycerol dehydrogenase [Burkholderia ambifaria]
MLRTMGFPGQYVQGPDALLELGRELGRMGFRRPLTLCDAIVGEKVWPVVERVLADAGLAHRRIAFPGECSKSAIDALVVEARPSEPDVMVALGGGKTIDSTKGVAASLGLPVVICPTVASNDSPTSRLIVLYDDQHKVTGIEYLTCNPAAVIVDTKIIAQAPARFFAAGIGDAVSKKFEARQCHGAGGKNSFGTPALHTALLLADATYDTLVELGPSAYRSVSAGQVDESVERVVEATVLLSGIGFESGGLSLAHALIRGLTAIPAMAAALHGELVAFGTLVQLLIEKRSDVEVSELLALLLAVHLPVTFDQLGQSAPLTTDEMSIVVGATLATRYSSNMLPALTADRLAEGLNRANQIGRLARLSHENT